LCRPVTLLLSSLEKTQILNSNSNSNSGPNSKVRDSLRREGQLQRYLRKLQKEGLLGTDTYRDIYPTGSQPARLYGLPKLHKVKVPSSSTPPIRPIVSAIGTYNYNLAKYLCSLFKPHISSEFCATDKFSFVR